jgi:hypothetical protein
MDYLKIYKALMNKSKGRELVEGEYYETHHMKPKSLGGTDDKTNLVKLTYREHFISHWLLHRIFPENKELAASFHIMAFGKSWRSSRSKRSSYVPSSRTLEEARLAKVFSRRGTKHSEETLEKMRGKRGPIQTQRKPISEKTKEKMRLAKLGKKRSADAIAAISNGKKLQTPIGEKHHRYGKTHSEETKQKLKERRNNRTKA